jgi:hypothetical protein
MTSKVGNMSRRRLEFSQALPTPKQRNLKSLAMQAGQNSMAARRRQMPIFEVVWVYFCSLTEYSTSDILTSFGF